MRRNKEKLQSKVFEGSEQLHISKRTKDQFSLQFMLICRTAVIRKSTICRCRHSFLQLNILMIYNIRIDTNAASIKQVDIHIGMTYLIRDSFDMLCFAFQKSHNFVSTFCLFCLILLSWRLHFFTVASQRKQESESKKSESTN